MINENLFDAILINPSEQNVDTLNIISGYATAAMAFHHLQQLHDIGKEIKINLLVGMTSYDGLAESNHRGFNQVLLDYPRFFNCSYIYSATPVHSKVYIWCRQNIPVVAFLGSANYSQMAFSNRQKNAMASADPNNSLSYYNSLIVNSIYCNHNEIENYITLYRERRYNQIVTQRQRDEDRNQNDLTGLDHVRVLLYSARNNEVHDRAGLNWGQREGREPNQAYIALTSTVYNSDFFPPRGVHFTVQTDDNHILICTRAQDNAKAIETPHNNSLLGLYFRNRLNLPNGAYINRSDLIRYGRDHVDFYKIDEENYFMDFSV